MGLGGSGVLKWPLGAQVGSDGLGWAQVVSV